MLYICRSFGDMRIYELKSTRMDIKDKIVLIADYCSLPLTFLLNGQPRRERFRLVFFFFFFFFPCLCIYSAIGIFENFKRRPRDWDQCLRRRRRARLCAARTSSAPLHRVRGKASGAACPSTPRHRCHRWPCSR